MSTKSLLYIPLLAGLAGLSPARTANAAVLWKGDFESGDLSQWTSSNLIETNGRKNLLIVSDSVADGTKAAKITLMEDIIFEPYNQSRVEVKHNGMHTENGEDSYFAWSFMVPADAEIRSNIGYWESTPTSRNTMTFHIEPGDDGGTDVVFGTGDLGQTERWRAKLALNQWHRIAMHNHWSQSDSDGRVTVWYDGVKVVSAATVVKRDANKLFFQMGLHRSDPSPPIQVIYIDAAVEADTEADILAPLPDPVGTGGTGGAGGAGGTGGAAGGTSAGAGGAAAGSAAGGAGATAGSAGGASTGATGGLAPSGGAPGSGGAGGGALPAQAGTSAVAPPAPSADSGGCSVAGASYASWRELALFALGCAWLSRRTIRRRGA